MTTEPWPLRHRRAVVFGLATVLVLGITLGSRVGFELDVMKVLPKGDRAVSDYLDVLDLFRGLDRVLIDVWRPGEPFDEATVRVAGQLCEILPKSEFVSAVKGRVGLDEMAGAYDVLTSHRASLFSAERGWQPGGTSPATIAEVSPRPPNSFRAWPGSSARTVNSDMFTR